MAATCVWRAVTQVLALPWQQPGYARRVARAGSGGEVMPWAAIHGDRMKSANRSSFLFCELTHG